MSPSIASKFYETPYIYNKNYFQYFTDAIGPTTPNGVTNDQLRSDGDSDFFARRFFGGLINFNDAAGRAFFSAAGNQASIQGLNDGNFVGFLADAPLAPEKLYPLGTSIPIQYLVQNNTLPSSNFLTFPDVTTTFVNVFSPGFQGVKRWVGQPNRNPNYKFYEKPFTYVVSFNQNWTYLVGPNYTQFNVADPRFFSQSVLDYDFELWAIEVGADYYNATNAGYQGYMMKLYDSTGKALMRDFVHYRKLSYNGGYAGGAGAPQAGNYIQFTPNCFPVPPVVYPAGSTIDYEILSLLDTGGGGGGAQYIHFRGVRRIPC